MRWSQLKKRFEATFADKVGGRVEVWATVYREAPDDWGECWITFDKKRVISLGDVTWQRVYYGEASTLQEEGQSQDYRDPGQPEAHYATYVSAEERAIARSVFSPSHLKAAMADYLNLSIEEVWASSDVLIKAFALLDRRFGKRRLTAFDPEGQHPLVTQFYEIRCEVEGLKPHRIGEKERSGLRQALATPEVG